MALLRIDSRQKEGKHTHKDKWFAEHGIETETVALKTGDYQTDSSNVLVDTKKDVDELAMDCGKDHARFVREIDRAAAAGCRLVVLVEQHPEYNDRENLKRWTGYKCRRCRRCDPNGGDRCKLMRYQPMCGVRLAKIVDKLESEHGARFEFCDKRSSAKRICELLGIEYE